METTQTSQTAGHQFLAGLQGVLPILLGVFPFGMIYGALARQAGLSEPAAQLMSSIIFAGSSQFIAVQLLREAAPGLVIILTILIVNLRHALYSASVSGYVNQLSFCWKTVLAYLLTDEAYAVAITRYKKEGRQRNHQYYFLGAGIGLWACWQTSTALGIAFGNIIPTSWPLDFALPLTFIALLVPMLKDRASLVAALAAGMSALLVFGLPYKLGILAAALTGIAAGMVVEGKKR